MLILAIVFGGLTVLSFMVHFTSSKGTKERLPLSFGSFLGTMALFFLDVTARYSIQLIASGILLEIAYFVIVIGWFRNKFFKKSPHDETDKTLAIVGLIVACFYAILILLIPGNASNNTAASSQPSSISSSTSSVSNKQDNVDNSAKSALARNGWAISDYVIGGKTDVTKDKSESGNDTFSSKITTKDQLGAFISKGDSKSKVFLQNVATTAYGKTYTSGSAETQSVLESEVSDINNWSSPIQSAIPFRYPGNTGLSKNGVIYQANSKSGDSGDIFFMYVPPESLTTVSSSVASDSSASSLKPVAVRGACGNPQLAIPTPAKKTTQSSTPSSSTPSSSPDHPHGGLTPKSPNPNDYIVTGKGKGNDVDSGSAPKATVITPPASSPSSVTTGGNDLPGSTTSAAVPDSSSAVSDRPSSQQLGPTASGTVAEPN